ncbi:hypothetical protein [Chitinophaga ginsengisegetis]|uniref:hypothetical protein n=1 Tax=Chitinophaga ginsengisegetis TaxID=393003 RepID=UPI000DB9A50F|nr:hypothetical protein [Chitinophaga ginsengisegetis]MDR6571172.1 hypothetical protein [Chitinophaga ginsengisegetis]MDR6650990.1 hypothetical protein [Chitinophaga ginsengisegetis]MDR6657256.1 hypothetical protein [Chitinophaga ginsengisegetis]
MKRKILLFSLLIMQNCACLQESSQSVAEKNVEAFVTSRMSSKATYKPISFTPLDSGAFSIIEVAPHFLKHKFQSITPNGEVVIEEWSFYMDASLNIVSYADEGKSAQIPRSDFGKNYDSIGIAADSVVNNILKETINN